jgi:glucose-6-phosphate dehydrogenase assembly protein OpcA
VGTEPQNESVAQALLIVAWLATRLDWTLGSKNNDHSFTFSATDDRTISVELNLVTAGIRKPGRLAGLEIKAGEATFLVARSEDNTHILAEARVRSKVKRGRVLPVRNRSLAQLLAREMEILANDRVYQETIAMVAQMIKR